MLFESLASRFTRHRDIARKLHDSTAKDLSDNDKAGLRNYVDGSWALNKALINGIKLNKNEKFPHDTIKKVSKPLGHKVSLYSGSNTDFGELAKESKDGILHSPAHLSTTHSIHTAKSFSIRGHDGSKHMIAIHAKPHDKGIHVSEIPGVGLKSERETIIPAGTKLKYSHSNVKQIPVSATSIPNKGKEKIHIHHFTIHSQD